MERKRKSSKCVKWNTANENRANGTYSLQNPLLHYHTNQLIVVVEHRVWTSVKGGKK